MARPWSAEPDARSVTAREFGRRAVSFGSSAGLVLAMVALWEVGVRVLDVADYVLPAPSQVARALVENASVLIPHVVATTTESVIGLVIGAAGGVTVAIMMGLWAWFQRVLAPLLIASQTVPIIVLAPLLVLWFGYGLGSKIAVVVLMTFFPVAISMAGGIAAVDPHRVDLMDAMGATRWQTMRFVRLPHAVPSAIDGLRISAAYAVGGAVVGEWTGAEAGLGVFIDRSRASFRIDQVFAGVMLVSILSFLLFVAVGSLGRLVAPWHYGRRLHRS